ncbi:MAG: RNA polymerase sigma-70 factor [bacterium]|jgi:RNA polymerase sigma-70 factor (ECF subfamily)|nr:MAG: RNA polymerase sigma-70 factor [bacterium]
MTDRDDAPTGCDAASIEALFRAHYSRLCDFVNCYVRSPETASDLVQDLFVHLWERCDAGDVPLLTTAYLYTAARNRALKHLRHRRVVARWAERVASAPLPTGPQADERLRTREMAEAIRRAIDALPDRCRQIFLLSREKYLSYAEIAEVLGISVKTVETQMWRALKSLRKSLAPYLGLVLTLAALARLGSHLVG